MDAVAPSGHVARPRLGGHRPLGRRVAGRARAPSGSPSRCAAPHAPETVAQARDRRNGRAGVRAAASCRRCCRTVSWSVSTLPAWRRAGRRPRRGRRPGRPGPARRGLRGLAHPAGAGVRGSGGAVVAGFEMLLHQAARQVELMTGQPAPVAAMRAAGLAAMGAPVSADRPGRRRTAVAGAGTGPGGGSRSGWSSPASSPTGATATSTSAGRPCRGTGRDRARDRAGLGLADLALR